MLDSKQQQWVAKVAKTLGMGKAEEDPKQRYEQSLKLLTPRFKQALAHDQGGVLSGKINSAVKLAQQGSFVDAQGILDDAGQQASQLISAKMQPRQTQAGLVGKALPGKYKDEQYQKDASGNVMHGGEFRGASRNRTKYYDDDERDASIVHKDDQGRLTDGDGNFLPKHQGFVMSQETGSLHTFETNERETSPEGYLLHTHHSSPIQGGRAAAAGEMETEEGVLRKVTDQSGHYRPTPEMTHQMIQGLEDAGVAMREKKLTMHGKDGNPEPAPPEIYALLNEVIAYANQHRQIDPPVPFDPAMLKKLQKLQDLGVTASNREAQVDLTNPKTFFSPEDFEKVKGNNRAIADLVAKKIGKKLTSEHLRAGLTTHSFESVDGVNNWIGVICRLSSEYPQLVDNKTTRLQMTTEQFAQTGGNVDAIRGKEGVNAEIQQQRKPDDSDEAETARLKKLIDNLGGDKKLKKLGVKDPTQLTAEQQFLILSKGRIPESLEEFGGGVPEIEDEETEASEVVQEEVAQEEVEQPEAEHEQPEQQEAKQETVAQEAKPLEADLSGGKRPGSGYTQPEEAKLDDSLAEDEEDEQSSEEDSAEGSGEEDSGEDGNDSGEEDSEGEEDSAEEASEHGESKH